MAGLSTPADALKRAFFALLRTHRPNLDYFALYHAVVTAQSQDRSTVDVAPSDPRLPPMAKVPLDLGIPGATAMIQPGAEVVVGWKNGDPQRHFAALFKQGATVVTLSITAGKVELGGQGLIPLLEQVVIGKTPCQFTGAPHAAMQPLSSKVFAKE